MTTDREKELLDEISKLKKSIELWRTGYMKFGEMWAKEYWVARDWEYDMSKWPEKYRDK